MDIKKSPSTRLCRFLSLCGGILAAWPVQADVDVELLNVPNYRWYAGCFGTATGNLFGYWDRNGFPDFYTGPTGDGLAPLVDTGTDGSGRPHTGIRSMWASKAGVDGRPLGQPGHIDDYWAYYSSDGNYSYESTATDPYVLLGRPEHDPDCIGDFIGLSQKKWVGMNGECDGNIDAYSFVYWDTNGQRRINYTPTNATGMPTVDIQSGLKAWSHYRGYEADVFTQLTAFHPATPSGQGFSLTDVKQEIHSGYPLMVFLQPNNSYYRSLPSMPKANPSIHGVLIYGYYEYAGLGTNLLIRTSWGSGETSVPWSSENWLGLFPVRGVIGYHPKPKITEISRIASKIFISWHGPAAQLRNNITAKTVDLHNYVVQRASQLPAAEEDWVDVTAPSTNQTAAVTIDGMGAGYFRVKLVTP